MDSAFLRRLFFTPVLWHTRMEALRFRRCCRDVAGTQSEVLARKLRLNGNSRLGRRLGIPSIDSVASFRARIPITAYEDYQEAIECCKRGDFDAMFGKGQDIQMFALSSGTTAREKCIPLNEPFLREYQRGWRIWGWHAYRDKRRLLSTFMLPITSSRNEYLTESGVPCGAISGVASEHSDGIYSRLFPVPQEVYGIKDVQTKYYLIGRFAIEKRVGSISSANPSTVLSVFRLIDARRDDIVRDVREGTLRGAKGLSDAQRTRLAGRLRPNPVLAGRLQGLIDRHGHLYPKHFWPALGLVSNWKGGSLVRYLDFYEEFFGGIEVREIGLIASEGRMTIAVDAHGSEGVLDVMAHFFEFVSEDDIEKKSPATFLAHELELGKRYFVLMTTSNGFYRYDIRDLVEVTGFYHQAPRLRFLNKGRHISSITGEKITENQVVEAVRATVNALGLPVEHYCVFPKWRTLPHYGLVLQEGDAGEEDRWGLFLRELDRALCRLNMEYEAKRKSGRLGPVSLFFVPRGTFDIMRQEKLKAQGGRAEQYKHVFLVPEDGLDEGLPVLREFSAPDEMACKAS